MGSSPLARGLHHINNSVAGEKRIIPARAGFTPVGAAYSIDNQDHPRSRGVYVKIGPIVSRNQGSSPLARGLQMYALTSKPRPGIIPARAGFTHRGASRSRVQEDHPRSRGVYRSVPRRSTPDTDHPRSRGVYAVRSSSTMSGGTTIEVGSSPLARGLHLHHSGNGVDVRIIPARAGFTGTARLSRASRPGSSPLARGLP